MYKALVESLTLSNKTLLTLSILAHCAYDVPQNAINYWEALSEHITRINLPNTSNNFIRSIFSKLNRTCTFPFKYSMSHTHDKSSRNSKFDLHA